MKTSQGWVIRYHSHFVTLCRIFLPVLVFAGVVSLTISSNALGRGSGKIRRSLPAGIIFPMFTSAALINASTLPIEKGTATQGLYSPPQNSDLHAYSLGLASAKRKFGFGIGYLGDYLTEFDHGFFVGSGLALETISLGLSLREYDIQGGFNPAVDFSLGVNLENNLHLGIVLYNLNGGTRISGGIGYTKKKAYNLEVNLHLPHFSDIDSTSYSVTVAAGVYAGIFGFSFATDYYASYSGFEHTIAATVWFMEQANFLIQFDTPNRFTFGLMIVF